MIHYQLMHVGTGNVYGSPIAFDVSPSDSHLICTFITRFEDAGVKVMKSTITQSHINKNMVGHCFLTLAYWCEVSESWRPSTEVFRLVIVESPKKRMK